MKLVLVTLLLFVIPVVAHEACPSALDGQPNSRNSWHKAHVAVEDCCGTFSLDDGTLVKLFITGGSLPTLTKGARGLLYVSVPSYKDDCDNTYYFQKFIPDKGEQKKAGK